MKVLSTFSWMKWHVLLTGYVKESLHFKVSKQNLLMPLGELYCVENRILLFNPNTILWGYLKERVHVQKSVAIPKLIIIIWNNFSCARFRIFYCLSNVDIGFDLHYDLEGNFNDNFTFRHYIDHVLFDLWWSGKNN